jgi:5-methylcytosine-specific restriction endonuclease McrA
MKKGQAPRYWTDQEVETAKLLKAEGLSYSEIGRRIGRERQNVRLKLDEMARARSVKACRDWYRNNTEKKKADSRNRYTFCGEQIRAQARQWRINNPGKRKAHQLRRRARHVASISLFAVNHAVIMERLSLASGMCCWCGSHQAITIDHFLPISKGGTHSPSNLLPACNSCNGRKQARDPCEWFTAQPFYSKKRWLAILKMVGKSSTQRHKIHHAQISFI